MTFGKEVSGEIPQDVEDVQPGARPLSGASAVAWSVLLTAGASAAGWWACGVSLGLVLFPVFALALLLPPLAGPCRRAWCSLACGAVGGLAAFGVVWVAGQGVISPPEQLRIACVLVAWGVAVAGLSALLWQWLGDAAVGSGWVVLLAWLCWPVWLAPYLSGSGGERIVGWLVPAHPLFAINGVVVKQFETWDRYPMAYQTLSNLNQDIAYVLPSGVWASAAAHLAVGLVAAWACAALAGRVQPEA